MPDYPPLGRSAGNQNGNTGCLLGCAAASLLAIILVALVAYGIVRFGSFVISSTTSAHAVDLPPATLSEDALHNLNARLVEFKRGLNGDGEFLLLTLNAEELNYLIENSAPPDLASKVRVRIDDDTMRGDVSLYLGDWHLLKRGKRYFNGTATFDISLRDGELHVYVKDLMPGGKPMPKGTSFGLNMNLAKDVRDDFPEFVEIIPKLQNIFVSDGHVVIVAKGIVEGTQDGSQSDGDSAGVDAGGVLPEGVGSPET